MLPVTHQRERPAHNGRAWRCHSCGSTLVDERKSRKRRRRRCAGEGYSDEEKDYEDPTCEGVKPSEVRLGRPFALPKVLEMIPVRRGDYLVKPQLCRPCYQSLYRFANIVKENPEAMHQDSVATTRIKTLEGHRYRIKVAQSEAVPSSSPSRLASDGARLLSTLSLQSGRSTAFSPASPAVVGQGSGSSPAAESRCESKESLAGSPVDDITRFAWIYFTSSGTSEDELLSAEYAESMYPELVQPSGMAVVLHMDTLGRVAPSLNVLTITQPLRSMLPEESTEAELEVYYSKRPVQVTGYGVVDMHPDASRMTVNVALHDEYISMSPPSTLAPPKGTTYAVGDVVHVIIRPAHSRAVAGARFRVECIDTSQPRAQPQPWQQAVACTAGTPLSVVTAHKAADAMAAAGDLCSWAERILAGEPGCPPNPMGTPPPQAAGTQIAHPSAAKDNLYEQAVVPHSCHATSPMALLSNDQQRMMRDVLTPPDFDSLPAEGDDWRMV